MMGNWKSHAWMEWTLGMKQASVQGTDFPVIPWKRRLSTDLLEAGEKKRSNRVTSLQARFLKSKGKDIWVQVFENPSCRNPIGLQHECRKSLPTIISWYPTNIPKRTLRMVVWSAASERFSVLHSGSQWSLQVKSKCCRYVHRSMSPSHSFTECRWEEEL